MTKLRRNDRCPCGSGRKVKQCCGANTPTLWDELLNGKLASLLRPASLQRIACSKEVEPIRRNAVEVLAQECGYACGNHSYDYRRLLEKHLLGDFSKTEVFSVARESWVQLEEKSQLAVYWLEMDCTYAHVVRWGGASVQRSLLAIAASLDDPMEVAKCLRQFLELSSYLAFYSWGCWKGREMLRLSIEANGPAFYTFKALEDFVRGGVAVDSARLALIEYFAGNSPLPDMLKDNVGEITASLAKQGSVVELIAESAGLADAYRAANDAYYLCCGLVHPTPLHLHVTFPCGDAPGLDSSIRRAMRIAALRSVRGMLELLEAEPVEYEMNARGPEFASLIGPIVRNSETPRRKVHLTSKILEDLKHRDNKVHVPSRDGTKRELYGGRSRRTKR